MIEQFEYAVRTSYGPGKAVTEECGPALEKARSTYDHQVGLHGRGAVEFLSRRVSRTPWVASVLPPAVDRDGGLCDPILYERPVRDTGSIDTYEEAQA